MKWFSLLILFSLQSLSLNAQSPPDSAYWESQLELDLAFAVAAPLTNFRREVDRNLVGFNSSLLFRLPAQTSIFAGVDVSYFEFANLTGDYFLTYDGFVDEFEVRSSTNMLSLHGKIRIGLPGYRRHQPYIEGLLGTKHLGTRSRVYEFPNGEAEQFDSYLQQSDWSLSYGGAVGFISRVYTYGDIDIGAHIRLTYSPGLGSDYLVLRDNYDLGFVPEDPYEEKFSTTNLLLLQIGVTFALGSEEFQSAYDE